MLFTPEILKKIRSELETATNEWGSRVVNHEGYIEETEDAKMVVVIRASRENLMLPSNWSKMSSNLMQALDCYEADTDHNRSISLDEFMEYLKNIE